MFRYLLAMLATFVMLGCQEPKATPEELAELKTKLETIKKLEAEKESLLATIKADVEKLGTKLKDERTRADAAEAELKLAQEEAATCKTALAEASAKYQDALRRLRALQPAIVKVIQGLEGSVAQNGAGSSLMINMGLGPLRPNSTGPGPSPHGKVGRIANGPS